MGSTGNQARRKRKRQQERRREKLERARVLAAQKYTDGDEFESSESTDALGLHLLLAGGVTLTAGLTTLPLWWHAHGWIGVVVFFVTLLLVVYAASVWNA